MIYTYKYPLKYSEDSPEIKNNLFLKSSNAFQVQFNLYANAKKHFAGKLEAYMDALQDMDVIDTYTLTECEKPSSLMLVFTLLKDEPFLKIDKRLKSYGFSRLPQSESIPSSV